MINKNIRNIGIFAHVDAGKTTLTENILFTCRCIRKIGRVDEGTAHTDNMDVERERGISVRAAAASVVWKGTRINIIDTPGHVDFSAEVERSIMALDGAVLVISAAEGVQSQTEIIFHALKEMGIPVIIFINKIDRAGADIKNVMGQIESMTSKRAIPVEEVNIEDSRNIIFTDFKDVSAADLRDKMCEFLAEFDDEVMERIVYGEKINAEEIKNIISKHSKKGEIYPVFHGTALKGIGIENVLDGILEYLPEPEISGQEDAAGIAYKIYNGRVGGKSVHTRLYEGSVRVRGTIYNYSRDIEEKITGILKYNGSEYEPSGTLEAGEIGILYGLYNTKTGDILGNPLNIKKKFSIASPTLTVQVFPERAEQLDSVVEAFSILDEEDPLLNVQWLDSERELHVQLMGMVQMEILEKIVKDRFGLVISFEKPSVVYKEAPLGIGTGLVDMTTPYFGALKIMVEPLERGKGYIYESAYTTDFIFQRFQNEVEETVPKVLMEGIYGWEVTDIRVTLTGGRSINLATKPSDFRAITPIAVMDAVKSAGTIILEPIQEYEISFNPDEAGTVIKDLLNMRAEIIDQSVQGDNYIIRGIVPVATSLDYPVRIAALSQGKSSFRTKFAGYRECALELAKIKTRKTQDPSDRERYLQSISRKNTRDRDVSKTRE